MKEPWINLCAPHNVTSLSVCLYLSDQQEDLEGSRGRVNGGGEELDFLFDLIEENEDEVSVRSKFPESWLFLTKEIG